MSKLFFQRSQWIKNARYFGVSSCLILLLAGCESGSSVSEQVVFTEENQIELSIPTVLSQARAVDQTALFADLELTYDLVSKTATATRQGSSSTWSTRLTIPTGKPFTLAVTWYDNADGVRLDLATVSRDYDPFTSIGDASVSIDFNDFDSDAFDEDEDSVSNLQERVDDTDPFDPLSPGVTPPTGELPIVLAECDALPIGTETPSNDLNSPIQITVGSLHSGTVVDDTVAYYDIALNPGRYALVLDANDVGGVFNSTVAVDRQDAEGEFSDRLVRSFDLDKIRVLADFSISAPETVSLRVSEFEDISSSLQAYTFGIFEAGDPIPSPFFTDCPTVIDVTDGVPVSFEFESGYQNEVFLAFDVAELGSYEADLFQSNIRGTGGLFSRVEMVDGYGQLDEGETVFQNLIAQFSTTAASEERVVQFEPRAVGRNWLRFRKRIIATLNNRYSMQATVSTTQAPPEDE